MCNGREFFAVSRLFILIVMGIVFLPASVGRADDLQVKIDEAHLIRLPSSGAEVIVGNPTIADVAVRSSKLLVVTGKSFGFTNVIVLDAQGDEILSTKISVAADVRRMVTLRKGVLRYSLHCTPDCQTPLVVGDDSAYFDTLQKANEGKFSTATSVASGSSPQPNNGR